MKNNPFSLEGKTILVTGASSGIGRGIAGSCAQFGAKVIVTGRSQQRSEETLQSLEGEGHACIVGDLTDAEFRKRLSKECPPLDGLVLNAGIMNLFTFRSLTDDNVDHMIEVNLTSSIKLFRDIYNAKKIKKGSSIVTISSINGPVNVGRANFLYSATKAGITAFTKGIAVDLGRNKVRANCIAPGMIETVGLETSHQLVSEEAIVADKAKYLLGTWGDISDVANGAIYLLSDASKFITGTTLIIDGGRTLITVEPSNS